MKGRPCKGTSPRSLPLLLGLVAMALVVGGASAEMASYAIMAKASDDSLLRIARGDRGAEAGEASSEMATISGVTVEEAGPGNASLLIQADRPLQTYESFALSDPPRLVVDIPNAQHAIHSYPALGANTLIQKIRSSQYKDAPTKVVRLVVDLTSPSTYQVEAKGDQLRISLGGEEKAAKGEEAATGPTTSPAASPPEKSAEEPAATAGVGKVTKIDYQAMKGKGRILISTEGKVKYEVRKISQPLSLVIDISPANIASPATQPLDVGLLPGQIDRLRATQSQLEPEKIVRVVADLKGMIKYEVSQNNAGIALDIFPSSAEAQAAAAPPAPTKAELPSTEAKKISMDFKDADINNLLRILAEVSGANIVSGPEVKGTVTVRLINVSWDQALEAILKSNNFGSLKEGNIIRVASLANISKELDERRKREAEELRLKELEKKEKVALVPLEQAIISVNYVSADKLMENLQPLVSKDPEAPTKDRGKLTLHQETKSIIINDTAEAIEKMRAMAARLDIRTPQVMIEARIITVSEDYTQALGIQWGGAYVANLTGDNVAVIAGSNPYSMTAPAGPTTGTPTMGLPGGAGSTDLMGIATSLGSYILNLPASPAGGAPIAGAVSLGYIGSRLLLDARISLAESEGKVKTLSSPKVATLDNKEAEIKAGQQIPFTTIDPSSGRLTISFQEAYLRLKVKPHVTSDKKINMEIEAENNTVGRSYPTGVGDVISINKRIAKTEMLTENGATVVLGGLYVSQESFTEDRIPFLGKIPIIGWLFKRRTVNPSTQELLIFITPSILEERKV
jgi:type IV pilus assembly protein PilQ